jgi:hypothetical protein
MVACVYKSVQIDKVNWPPSLTLVVCWSVQIDKVNTGLQIWHVQMKHGMEADFHQCPSTEYLHSFTFTHFLFFDDVGALEASSKPPVHFVEDNVTASLH